MYGSENVITGAEAMTAPRAREQRRARSPPDRLPPRRGGRPSPYTYAVSAASRLAGFARLAGARHSRSTRALAAAAWFAVFGVVALPATAQAGVLVSNLGQSVSNSFSLTEDHLRAQAFSAPSGGEQYTLASIEIPFGNAASVSSSNIGSLNVSVWSADFSGHPASSLYTLTNPSSIAASTTATFTAPTGATLEAGNTYVVVLHHDYDPPGNNNGPNPTGTTSNTEDSDFSWTIADTGLWRESTVTSWNETSYSILIRVNGSVVGIPDISGTAVTSSPDVNSSYETGDVIQVTVTFSEAVTVDTTLGTPRLLLTTGSSKRFADYSASGSTATALVFAYPVTANDHDKDGIDIRANALKLSGGAIHKEGDPTPVCDRTDQVRDEIVVVSGVSTCGGVTDANLAAITFLGFNFAGITSLKEGDFSGLTALQELDLQENDLSSLPDDVFSGLTALRTLNLRENELSSLPDGVFSGLTALQELDLQENDLNSLPAGVFSGLTALQEIYLYANDLSSLPDGVFSGLTALVQLELDGNAVDPLPVAVSLEPAGPGRFKAVAPTAAPFALTLPVSVVNGVIVGGATTLTIPAGMVHSDPVSVTRSAGSTSAVTADIGTLPELPSNHRGYALEKSSDLPLEILAAKPGAPTPVCDRTDQVRDEIVVVSGVSTCGGVTDANLAAITVLSLTSVGITSLKEGDFSGLTSLRELYLDSNELSPLPDGVFSGLTALQVLQLESNDLSSLPDGVFSGLTSLQELYLHYNDLNSLPDGVFSGLTALQEIYLYANDLSSLPDGVFSGLTALMQLELDGNAVDPLPVAVSLEPAGPGRFKAVAPTAAPFALTLPVSIVNGVIVGGATTLTIPAGMVHSDPVSVTRSAGSTSAVTADIGTLPELPSNHRGYALEKSSDLPLEILAAKPGAPTPVCDRTDQVRDEIVVVSGVSTCGGVTDANLAAITVLSLTSVGITSLKEGDFSGLTSLRELYLDSNELSPLPDGVFSGLTALQVLQLESNDLSSLPDGVFSGLTSLQELYLHYNDLNSLPDGVFSGLTALQEIYLYANDLSSLPDGVFSGLTALMQLELDGNAVDPLPVAVSLEPAGPGRFKAVAPTAAPFALTLPVSIVNGVIVGGATTLTIPAGMVHSDPVSVTRSAGSTSAVTADIGTLPELPSNHRGYALEKSSDLPLEILAAKPGAPTPVCDRTDQVRDEIVVVSGVSTCGGVTDANLAAITVLSLNSVGITSLKEGDFSGLTALQVLQLESNDLSSLPDGVFSGLTSLQELYLHYNDLNSLPDGVFSGLTALQEIYLYANDLSSLPDGVFSGLTALMQLELDGNAVDPLPVAVSLEPAGPGRFKAVAPTAAPFALTLPVSIVNGVIVGGATTLTIPAGMVHSDPVSVTRSAGTTSAVTADIGTLPELPSNHRGYALEKSSDLPLEILAAKPGAPTPTVTLVLSDASIGENGGVSTVTATVSPASAAAFTVTVAAAAVSPAVAADFRLSANRVLSFAENATTSTGSVTITGVDNDVDATDKTVTVSGTVSATGVTAPVNRTLTLEDDDAAGVTVSKAALTVTEQDTTGDSYTVVLDTEPTHDVTVAVGGHAGTDVSLSASTLTFTPSNWDRAQTVTVTALNDNDTANDAVTLTHTATSTDGNYSGITIAGVSVTVTDNDTTTPTVTLVLSDASIGENGGVSTVTATVSPASATAFTVTVAAAAVSPAVAADFRLSANRVLSFAENATTSTGTVTITGVDNDVDAADKTVTVSGTVSATGVTAPATRTLTLEDDDAAGVTVSKAALTVTEQDTTGDSYTVVLDTEPTHEVTVTVDGHAGTDVSLSASTLTFTPSNWDRAQTVTVTALNDDDTANDAVTLTHTATSTDGNYSGITIAGVSVTVTDNDTTTPTVTLVLSDASIGENGGVSTVTATVSPASAAAFTVTVAAAAVSPAVAADFRLSANRVLNFAENATTSTGSVTITGVDNDVDATDKTVTVSGTVSATGVTAPVNRTLTLEDDDAAGVTVSKAALTVTEQDTTGDSYTVVLDTEPTHEVTVTVGGHSGTDVSLSASTLTFTPSNWDRAQTVTVTALNDDDTANDAVTLTHTATSTDGNYSGITIAGVSVTVTDNDTTTPTVTLVLSDGSIGENGGVSTVTATVSPASATAFTVTVAAAAVSPAVAADFRLSANPVLSFAENATTSTGTVTITGVDNDVDATDKTVTVSGTVSATGVTAPATRTLTLEDDDAAGVTVSKAALTVTEQDTTGDSYTVVLDTEPTHDVTVTVDGHAGTDVSLSASTLTFTPSNWDRAQTVTVTALNDDDTANDAVTLTHTATSTDGNYSGITIAGVSVTVTDNDTTTPTVTLVLSDASIGENGGVSTVTATVSPASAAAFTVTVAAAAVSPAVAADFRLSANPVLSFAENATTSTGTVTITGVDNDVDAADKTVTVSGTVSATGVTAPVNRTLTLEDDDAAGATVSATALTVTEQDTTGDSYTVVLDTEPTHEVTVTVGGHSGTDVSLSASTLTFTPSNWDRAQTVTVTALNDDDTANDAVTLTHTATSTDGNYSGITIAGVSVTVTDNDTTTPTVTLVLSDGSIGENGGVSTVTATVSPASATAFTVTVAAAAVSPAVAADFRLSANPVLSFAENATTSTGTVTITGVDNDVDAADKTVTVSGTVSATGVTAPVNRTLTLEDDDAAGATVSATALTVTEQDTTGDSYTVVLDTEPTHEVTVTVGGHSGTDVSLSASTLTFTPSNWDRAQTVTVTALNDDDTANDAVTLTHTATSTDGNYSGITIAGVSVTVTDNDTTTPTVTLVLSDGSIGENGGVSTVTATVSPASATAFTVTVAAAAVSPAVAADFRLSANPVLSFAENATTSTGTVTITGVDNDVDAADKTVTVSGTVSATGVTAPVNRTLTLEDDDAAGATVSATALTVTEQDTTGDSYTVVLDTEPTHEVTVTVGGHSGTDVSLSASTLTFTPSNWDRAQTVTVTALNDDDTANDAVTLTHTATSTDGNYSGIAIAGVSVTVTDNDTTTPTVTLVLSDGSIGENGGVSTVTATVSPASATAFTVTVAAAAVSPAVAADFRLSANPVLSFAENATTSTGTVTITGVDNDVDAADKTVTVSGTVSATGVTAPVNRTLTLEDDDAAPPPVAPEAEPVSGSYTSLSVSWTATVDGAAVTGYELRYREHPDGRWEDWPHDGTATTATIAGLEVNTAYQVEVRALYGETPGEWSPSGMARTPKPPPARVRNVSIVNGPGSDGVWSAGEQVEVEVVYPVPVVVEKPEDCWSYNADGTCRESGPFVLVVFRDVFRDDARPGYGKSLSTPLAPYVGGSGTATLRFAYTVGEDEDGARRVEPADNGILLRGATIRTLEGGDGASIYTNTRVMQVTVRKPGGGAWTAGDTVRVAVRFAGPVQYTPPDDPENLDEVVVDETGGVPTIRVLLGDRVERTLERTATYVSGSGKDTLVFEYEVTAGDGRVGAVEVVADSLAKNGATIRNKDGYDAELDHLGAVRYAPADRTTESDPPTVSVADARVREAAGATLDFVVTLSGASTDTVTVDYRTVDASARAGADYTARQGTLTFRTGQTSKTVQVTVLDDAHDEGEEKMALVLYRSSGATRADYLGVGTIENTDPMPKAWLARFGRTVSGQVLDAVEERLRASRTAGVTVSVAGQTIDLTAQPNVELETENETQARLPVLSDWLRQETNNGDRAGMQSRTVTLAELLMGSSFAVAGETDDGSSATVWGRMAQSSFSSREAGLSLDGDVTTGLLGADYARGSWTGGAVLSHSSGEGGYSGDATGKVKASMTAMAPWAGYSVTDRLSVWGALGYGTGDLTLTPKNPKTQKDQPAQKTDIAMTLAAAGVRGTLVDGDGPKLDAVADARWVRTTSEKVTVSAENGGNLRATQANVTRVRLGLEGSWAMALDDKGTTLTPHFSFGMRRDGGDAETGFGADFGGGLIFAMPASGLMLSLEGRGLINHEADGLSDTGYQASVGYDPAPSSDLGLSLSLRQSFGGSATGGKDTLFSRELMDGLTANGNDGGSQRLEGKIGYGMPAFGDRFTGTPEFGFAVSGTERAYSLGWRLSREGLDAGTFQSSLEATRRESANDNDPEHGIGFRFTARF